MDKLDVTAVSIIENPVVFKGKADEIGRIIMICFSDTGEARNKSANRHEVGDEFMACIFTKLFVDVSCDVISLAAEGRCKDDAPHASMERAALRRSAIRRFISFEVTWSDNNTLTFLQLPAGLLDVRATVHACCIGEHGAGIVINWYDWK